MTNETEAPERIWAQPPTTFDEYDVWTAYPSGEAIEYTRVDLVATATLPISDAKDARIAELETKLHIYEGRREAVDFINAQDRIAELEAKLHIYEGRNGQPVSSTGMVDEMADALKQKDARIEELEAELAKAIGALTSIEKWAGEFPPTNKFWPHGKPMSYVAAYGSNGERDFMREKARKTIAEIQGNP